MHGVGLARNAHLYGPWPVLGPVLTLAALACILVLAKLRSRRSSSLVSGLLFLLEIGVAAPMTVFLYRTLYIYLQVPNELLKTLLGARAFPVFAFYYTKERFVFSAAIAACVVGTLLVREFVSRPVLCTIIALDVLVVVSLDLLKLSDLALGVTWFIAGWPVLWHGARLAGAAATVSGVITPAGGFLGSYNSGSEGDAGTRADFVCGGLFKLVGYLLLLAGIATLAGALARMPFITGALRRLLLGPWDQSSYHW